MLLSLVLDSSNDGSTYQLLVMKMLLVVVMMVGLVVVMLVVRVKEVVMAVISDLHSATVCPP